MTRSRKRPGRWPGAGSEKVRRRSASAVVVLTDGVDTHSRLTPGEVSGIASEIDVPVYVVAVMSAIDDPRMFDDSGGGNRGRPAGSGAMDWRRVVHGECAGADERGGAANRQRAAASVSAGVRGVAEPRLAIAGNKGARAATWSFGREAATRRAGARRRTSRRGTEQSVAKSVVVWRR